jgi:Domain of unknown function (DUF1707)
MAACSRTIVAMSDEHPPPGRGPVAPALRASDEDRDRLVDELNEHAVAGRLDTDEFEQRLKSAYAARTTTELDTLRRDLPRTPRQTALSQAQRRSQLTRRMLQEAGGSLGLFIVCTIIWAASGAHGQFWPVWVLIVVVATLARSGWALFGPAPDLDAVEARLDAQRRERERHRGRVLTDREQRRADRHERRRGR